MLTCTPGLEQALNKKVLKKVCSSMNGEETCGRKKQDDLRLQQVWAQNQKQHAGCQMDNKGPGATSSVKCVSFNGHYYCVF